MFYILIGYSHWLLYECFFSFLIKSFAKSEKLIIFHHQAFVICKNWESLKILKEIFRQKRVVFNVILAFLNYVKPKVFFAGQPWSPTYNAPFSESLDLPLFTLIIWCNKLLFLIILISLLTDSLHFPSVFKHDFIQLFFNIITRMKIINQF